MGFLIDQIGQKSVSDPLELELHSLYVCVTMSVSIDHRGLKRASDTLELVILVMRPHGCLEQHLCVLHEQYAFLVSSYLSNP